MCGHCDMLAACKAIAVCSVAALGHNIANAYLIILSCADGVWQHCLTDISSAWRRQQLADPPPAAAAAAFTDTAAAAAAGIAV